MSSRPVISPSHRRSWLFFIVLLFVFALLFCCGKVLVTRTASQGAQPPEPVVEPTPEQLLARIIDDTRRLGEKLSPTDPREGWATLRIGLGQNLCNLTYWLNGARLFDHRDAACEVLWDQWPLIAESCPVCER